MSNKISKLPHIHVIYESGPDYRPYSSSFLRLIRPLTHPLVQEHLSTSFGLDYNNEPADVVIIDRLWRSNVSLKLVQDLVNKIRFKGAHLVYSVDDNYLDLQSLDQVKPGSETSSIVTFLLQQADAVLVTTPALSQRFQEFNPKIYILPNQLDERLLVIRQPALPAQLADRIQIVVGYMGTFTHDSDLMMILPALQSIARRYPHRVQFQVVGVINNEDIKNELSSLPLRFVYPHREEHEYPLFMPWFTGHVHWDIAISPLLADPFNDCKSDIKFLDYASIGAASIFSNVPAYTASVQHQRNGWLTENTQLGWEDALSNLIEKPDLRIEIAQCAYQYLYSSRILAHRAGDWVEIFRSLW
ncbi:MAG: hypothetical protein C3F13_17385 [Anaerolineales bacterium]|nr:MAG: hypothetical protein C3F13_17385 [Anaerolineales bacterium]